MKTNIPSNPTSGTAAQYAQNLQLLADRQYIDRRVNIGQAYKTKPTPSNSTAANLLYPNPASGMAYINNPEAIEQVIIYDIHGKQQMQQKKPQSVINLEGLESGIYIARFYFSDNSFHTQKLNIIR